ncbi:MAG TPA: PadR family transcriptional regulator [Thermoanaerobaculia bacterium]|jgi:PadR family transcriptional regulator PadR
MAMSKNRRFLANWDSQARKGVLVLIVMSALSKREYYGYELVEHILTSTGVEVSDGTLYAILVRLKAEGLVRTRWEAAERGPARKYYALTADGRAAFAEMKRAWTEFASGVDAILHDRSGSDVP